jgi:hypothetical protein
MDPTSERAIAGYDALPRAEAALRQELEERFLERIRAQQDLRRARAVPVPAAESRVGAALRGRRPVPSFLVEPAN